MVRRRRARERAAAARSAGLGPPPQESPDESADPAPPPDLAAVPPPVESATPPAAVGHVGTAEAARALAYRLLTPGRLWPVVVISSAAGTDTPYVDARAVKAETGDLAEVIVMPTGEPSWAFSREMPDGTQVYGGASRVYGVDHGWVTDVRRSRLHLAYSASEGERVAERLVQEALAAALSAGLLGAAPDPTAEVRQGVVKSVLDGRALVQVGDDVVALAEELTVPGLPLDRLVTVGQRVTGSLDPATRLLDVRAAILPTHGDAAWSYLAERYAPGDVVLAEVATVHPDDVSLRLLPGVCVTVHRDAVTGNERDHLDDLFTVGEVVLARVVAGTSEGAPFTLRLDDVDDAEDVPVAAPSLLPGGPPWLVASDPRERSWLVPTLTVVPAPADDTPEAPPAPSTAPDPAQTPPPRPDEPEAPVPPTLQAVASTRPVAPPVSRPLEPHARPTPRDLWRSSRPDDRAAVGHGAPVTDSTKPRAALRQLSLSLDESKAQVARLEREVAELRGAVVERDELHRHVVQVEAELQAAQAKTTAMMARYRQVDRERQRLDKKVRHQGGPPEAPLDLVPADAFADPVEQLRFEVQVEWVRRIPASDKAVHPLAPWTIGPDFLPSLESLEGVGRPKVVQVIVEILTGLAPEIASREVHRLRSGTGGDDPVRVRDDGAVAYRAALQIKTPSARRIHYWKLPGGEFELARVVVHDDFGI